MADFIAPKRQVIWLNLSFFLITGFFALVVAPIHSFKHGFNAFDWALFAFFVLATGLSITVGYHRLFAHATFKANRIVHFFVLFFGGAAFEQSVMDWASQHREHHRFVDTEQDPYSIKKGFFYAHIGWLIFWKHHIDHSNVKDLTKNPVVVSQNVYYHQWAVVAGILFPVALGALFGRAYEAFLLAVCARVVFVHHSTFFINSICHTFGKPTFDIHSTAKDHWFVAILTNGEGYHNFHHRFPTDFRNGVRWYHWDPSKWTIMLLSKIGWAWDLQTVSEFSILQAKLSAENQSVSEKLSRHKIQLPVEQWQTAFKSHYGVLTQKLLVWEHAVKEHQAMLVNRMNHGKEEFRKSVERMKLARVEFMQAKDRWSRLSRQYSMGFEPTL